MMTLRRKKICHPCQIHEQAELRFKLRRKNLVTFLGRNRITNAIGGFPRADALLPYPGARENQDTSTLETIVFADLHVGWYVLGCEAMLP